MGRKAVVYEFESCRCMGINGQSEWIPEGKWPVSDLGNVVVLIRSRVIELERIAFQDLKASKQAVRMR